MFSIHMNDQDKTNQITDWKLSIKRNKVMVTVEFPSGKSFTSPLEECTITPEKEINTGLLSSEKDVYRSIESAVEYGNKYIVVKYENDPKKYILDVADTTVAASSNFTKENVFSYFVDIIEERIQLANPSNKVMPENIKRQLDKIIPHEDTALYAYCNMKNKNRNPIEQYIFPFGINESQLKAVENAFSSQISIIEGPPGTGKSQTILNIIANIIVNEKSVAIVSNNNAAVENVYERMAKHDLDYIVAELGSKEKKKTFFNDLKESPPYTQSHTEITINEIEYILGDLKTLLTTQNKVAQLNTEISELKLEKKHLEEWREENFNVSLVDIKRYKLSSEKTTDLLAYINQLSRNYISFKERFHLLIEFRIFKIKFLKSYSERLNFTYSLQFHFYDKMIYEKQHQLKKYEDLLESGDFKEHLDRLTEKSMEYLKQQLSKTIPSNTNLTIDNYKKNFSEFIKRFPVIGSSTHSIINSIADGAVLDYIIIDEASQQDIVPGILSLGCAKNIIVVGDRKQLPHIPEKTKITAPSRYYDCTQYSLLDSFVEIFKESAPLTLLKEHYRCHPKIIQFCNQQFYNNQLIPMTKDSGESSIELITTAKGSHTRNQTNLREIESILKVGLPDDENIGFIAPYNKQVSLAKNYLPEEFVRATIHKFQGRECEQIIFSTVLDKKKSSQYSINFVDNPHLVNVAVSRAKNKFTLVTGDEVFTNNNKSLAALTRYIKYYASSDFIYNSPVISAFDLLYEEYDQSLKKLNARLNPTNNLVKSEKIFSLVLEDVLQVEEFNSLKYHMQIDLSQLASIKNDLLTEREIEYMKHKARCDFVIYYKVGKAPIGVIEIDGGSHDEDEAQKERDRLKNSILEKSRLPLIRIKTIEGELENKLKIFLNQCITQNEHQGV